jgi:AcrR family transcriptional regulator
MGMRKRVSRADQTEQNGSLLLEAARKVFVRRGYHAATVDQVASAAGLTKGAVYARFDGKADMMLALLEQRVEERTAQMKSAARNVRPHAAVAAALTRQWAELARSEEEWSLLVLEFRVHAARDRALNARFRAINAKLREAIAEVIAQSVPKEQSPEDLARVAMALTDGFALDRTVDGNASLESLYETAAAALVRGFQS